MRWLPQGGGISDRTLRRSGSSDPLREGTAAIMHLMIEQAGTVGFSCQRCACLVRMIIQMRTGREREEERKGEGEMEKERREGRRSRAGIGGERGKREREYKAKAHLRVAEHTKSGTRRAALAFLKG